jgi:hypothetical protein
MARFRAMCPRSFPSTQYLASTGLLASNSLHPPQLRRFIMAHSLAQEMTMIIDVSNLEEAEQQVQDMQHQVQNLGMDPAFVLESAGIEPKAVWINELLDLEQDSDLEYD